MKHDYIKRLLSIIFLRIGYHIGCYALRYILLLFLLTAVLATGFLKLNLVKDIEYLYSPINARGRTERATLESLFPPRLSSDFDFFRISKAGRLGSVIAVSKNNASMLNESIIETLLQLDKIIQNITVTWNNSSFSYKELCCRTSKDNCYENFVLTFKGKTEKIKKGKFAIKYPFERNNGDPITSAMLLGGVSVNETNYIRDFRAIRLLYMLDYSTEVKEKITLKWEDEFLKVLSNVKFQNIKIYKFVGQSFDMEVNRISEMVLPLLFIAAPLMVTFAALSCLSSDVVTSKPWLGIAGCISPIMSTIAAFGLLLHCNAEYIDLNLAIMFLMLGIGIDDSFVLLAAWRRTNKKDDVKHRMSEAYSEAAVSITITSLTNFLSFCIGLTTPYRVIRIFSLYSAISLLFDFFYQIFFFGSFMALEGIREEKQLHSVICLRIKSVNRSNEHSENGEIEENFMMKFFRDILGNLLKENIIKLFVFVVFVIYLGFGIYCTKWIKEGFDYINILPSSSYLLQYMIAHYEYFTDYPQRIHLIINKTLDYSDPTVQNNIENILQSFESAPLMADSSTTECWLREYLAFFKEPISKFSLSGYNLSNSEDFVEGFKDVFLKFKSAERLRKDVLFNKEGNQIIASRFLVQSRNVRNASAEKFLLENLRKIADNSKYPVCIYNFWFIIYDQYLDLLPTCIQTIGIAALLISIVFLLFIPNFTCVACVTLTVISIQVGVIGYISVWDVTIDTVSMIILVLCTGFCVDYSAHISYSYMSSEKTNPNEKLKSSLYAAGYPIFQGCISTVLGVSVLYFAPSYSFVIFFKIILLVMLFSSFHGLILLPVILTIGDSLYIYWKNRTKKDCPCKEKDYSLIENKSSEKSISYIDDH